MNAIENTTRRYSVFASRDRLLTTGLSALRALRLAPSAATPVSKGGRRQDAIIRVESRRALLSSPRVAAAVEIVGSSLGASTLIADLEQLLGCRVIFNAYLARFVTAGDYDYVIYTALRSRFPDYDDDFGSSFDIMYNVFRQFIFTKDLDLVMDYMKSVYDFTHFPLTESLFLTFSKIFSAMWGLANYFYGASGLYMEISGKLSRHLLTKARTAKLRLGKTPAASVSVNVIYRYRQTTSETGAYGLSVWYYTKSPLAAKNKRVEVE